MTNTEQRANGVLSLDSISVNLETEIPTEEQHLEEKDEPVSNQIENHLIHGVSSKPTVFGTILYGLQQTLMAIGPCVMMPLIIADTICAKNLQTVKAEMVSTFLVMCGISTALQTFIGSRLPIIQGGSFAFIAPIITLMSLETWRCPDFKNTDLTDSNVTKFITENSSSTTGDEPWKVRMRELQGALILASFTQIIVGTSGILGLLLRFIGPLTISPCLTLLALSLWKMSLDYSQIHWGISGVTLAVLLFLSLYLKDILVPLPYFRVKEKKTMCFLSWFPLFKVLPVIIAVTIGWILAVILTKFGYISNDPSSSSYLARTDVRTEGLHNAKWFYVPYPGQWGFPTVSASSYIAMICATITSVIESIGDYYACAKMCNLNPPPMHALNRGIAMEGFGSFFAGLFGTGGGLTSYATNIGAIGFTHVASRRVFITSGLIFIIFGVIGKFGAFAAMIPEPVLGGLFIALCGLGVSIGISALGSTKIDIPRNQIVFGISIMIGLVLPEWIKRQGSLKTGSIELDQILTIILGTPMLVGSIVGFTLDNTVPGTPTERGILEIRQALLSQNPSEKMHDTYLESDYDLPFITGWLYRQKWTKHIPFLPPFKLWKIRCKKGIVKL